MANAKKLHISKAARVKVHMGYRTMRIVVELPVTRIAENAVIAAFGKGARILRKRT